MKTKSTDRIRLVSGEELTLGEALDQGKLSVDAIQVRSRRAHDGVATRYVARGGGLSWEIGRALFESRSGLAVSAARPIG
jgi:hypothetical protein